MESKRLVALLCQRCGSPLPDSLKCEYCNTSHIIVENAPGGQGDVAIYDDWPGQPYELGGSSWEPYDQDQWDDPYGPYWIYPWYQPEWGYSEHDLWVVLKRLGDSGYFEYADMVSKVVDCGYAKWLDRSFAGMCGNANLTEKGKRKLEELSLWERNA